MSDPSYRVWILGELSYDNLGGDGRPFSTADLAKAALDALDVEWSDDGAGGFRGRTDLLGPDGLPREFALKAHLMDGPLPP